MSRFDKKFLVILLALLAILLGTAFLVDRANAGVIGEAEWVANSGVYSRTIQLLDDDGDDVCDHGTYTVVQNSIVIFKEELTCEQAKDRIWLWMETYGKTGFIPDDEF